MASDIPEPSATESEPHVEAGYTTAAKGLPRKWEGDLKNEETGTELNDPPDDHWMRVKHRRFDDLHHTKPLIHGHNGDISTKYGEKNVPSTQHEKNSWS